MTGDGVNDVLALKDSDLGIAMGSGAAATRAVAQIVLLDNSFAVMPSVVAEGRRVLGNIERVSVLSLTKSFYSAVLSLLVVFVTLTSIFEVEFVFLPRHLTVIDWPSSTLEMSNSAEARAFTEASGFIWLISGHAMPPMATTPTAAVAT